MQLAIPPSLVPGPSLPPVLDQGFLWFSYTASDQNWRWGRPEFLKKSEFDLTRRVRLTIHVLHAMHPHMAFSACR